MRLLDFDGNKFPLDQQAKHFVCLNLKRPAIMVRTDERTAMNVLECR